MTKKVAVVGLGYVGLPLAAALAGKGHPVFGYDISLSRIQELRRGLDKTGEVASRDLSPSNLHFDETPAQLSKADIIIITVPTPVDAQNLPDLAPLKMASQTVGQAIKGQPGKLVVFESTVYPGITENICGGLIEEFSGLKMGEGFVLGYAPERMNPGDKEHGIAHITKVVAAQTHQAAQELATLYGQLNGGKVFLAKDIQTAEAAKVIENAQRDINIAFINEVTTIFKKLGLSIYDVLDAAQTKWNFLPFKPGLVGGHCIGVDPYYLAQCAKNLGHQPDVILAGRSMNNRMSTFLGDAIHQQLKLDGTKKARLLVLGLTFKENVPDLRNSKVKDLIDYLKKKGHAVIALDPWAPPHEVTQTISVENYSHMDQVKGPFDGIILAVGHHQFCSLTPGVFKELLSKKGRLFDVKGLYRQGNLQEAGVPYWSL